MSDKPYQKECIFCKQKIVMSNETGKWLPFDLNNGPHECQKKNSSVPTNGNGNDLSVEVLLKRLESVGVKLDLSKLRVVK